MNISGINMSNALTEQTGGPVSTRDATASFKALLSHAVEEKLKVANHPAPLKSSQSLRDTGDGIGSTEEKNKYCSVCGSMIDEEGKCPLCVIPLFIHGDTRRPAQMVSQTDHPDAAFTDKPNASSKGSQIG